MPNPSRVTTRRTANAASAGAHITAASSAVPAAVGGATRTPRASATHSGTQASA